MRLSRERLRELASLARSIVRRRPIRVESAELKQAAGCIERALEQVRQLFPRKSESWYTRAVVRCFTVREMGEGRWSLAGIPEYGDEYPNYRVYWSESEGKYECECMRRLYGNRRRREVCTHVAAVILYRRMRSRIDTAGLIHRLTRLGGLP